MLDPEAMAGPAGAAEPVDRVTDGRSALAVRGHQVRPANPKRLL
ncbi:hypothetical protein [Actinomadura roseirufa]|nr:hypothetical protein [Actinomadura roseirufa]